jgi:uncharacterized protein YndB with AHSA1/START domain
METNPAPEARPAGRAGATDPVADKVTGATTEVTVVVDRSLEEVWDFVTDAASIGRLSPEPFEVTWLDGASGAVTGAAYHSRNRFPDGYTSEVICRVVVARPPTRYAWDVLDVDDPEGRLPLARWEYELSSETASQTVITHRFVHGPGTTNVRLQTLAEPDRAAEIIEGRLAELNQNMTTTLAAMFAGMS